MSRPLVSVVVALFNKAPYVERCLQSIRSQTFAEFEVIVVDDGSSDGGADVARAFADARVRVIAQPNRGCGAARNRGIQAAQAEIVAFLDADDEWRPDFLEAVTNLARRYPSAGLFATGFRRCFGLEFDKEITLQAPRDTAILLIPDYLRQVREGDFVTSSSTAARRAVLEQSGGFAENEPMGEDVDLWARITLRHPLAFDTRVLAIYHSEAAGRACEYSQPQRGVPPVVRTLRAVLAQSRVLPAEARVLQAVIDWRVLQHAYWLLGKNARPALRRFLQTEMPRTPRYACEAALLRAALSCLPLRIVRALKWKPMNWREAIRRRRPGAWFGDRVLTRYVPRGAGWPAPRTETAELTASAI